MQRRDVLLGGLAALIPGVSFAGNIVHVPIELLPEGTVLISAMLNGKGPYKFIMDTGASVSGIHDQLAVDLGLSDISRSKILGMGGSTETVVYIADNVTFGGAVRQSKVALTGFKNLRTNRADGLLAAGFLTTLPSELDFEAREIRLYYNTAPDFSTFHMLDSFKDTTSDHTSAKVIVKAAIDGLTVRLLVDTGFSGEVLLSAAFVRRHGLWDKYPDPKPVTGYGVSGKPTPQRLVRIPNLDLGGLRRNVGNVKLVAPDTEETAGYDGLIGIQVLREFTICFADSKGIGFKPNAFYGAPWPQT